MREDGTCGIAHGCAGTCDVSANSVIMRVKVPVKNDWHPVISGSVSRGCLLRTAMTIPAGMQG